MAQVQKMIQVTFEDIEIESASWQKVAYNRINY